MTSFIKDIPKELEKEYIFPDSQKYVEIPATEYKRLKKSDPKNVNGYTARIRFKYFKLRAKEDKNKQLNIIKDMLITIARDSAEIIKELEKIK
jgi:hypothetical protein